MVGGSSLFPERRSDCVSPMGLSSWPIEGKAKSHLYASVDVRRSEDNEATNDDSNAVNRNFAL